MLRCSNKVSDCFSDEQTREVAEWVQRRHQIVEMLTAERNRLRAMTRAARTDIETCIDWLEKAACSV
jgi:hypothetical protein